MNSETLYQNFILPDVKTQFIPKSFEGICQEYLIWQNRNNRCRSPFYNIGKYYHDPKNHMNGEFHVVTKGPDGYIFYEVEYRKEPVDLKQIEEEIGQVRLDR